MPNQIAVFAVPDMGTPLPALIGIDWGNARLHTSQFGAGNVQQAREYDRGIATIGDGSFNRILTSLLKGWPRGLPILMRGMVAVGMVEQSCASGAWPRSPL